MKKKFQVRITYGQRDQRIHLVANLAKSGDLDDNIRVGLNRFR